MQRKFLSHDSVNMWQPPPLSTQSHAWPTTHDVQALLWENQYLEKLLFRINKLGLNKQEQDMMTVEWAWQENENDITITTPLPDPVLTSEGNIALITPVSQLQRE